MNPPILDLGHGDLFNASAPCCQGKKHLHFPQDRKRFESPEVGTTRIFHEEGCDNVTMNGQHACIICWTEEPENKTRLVGPHRVCNNCAEGPISDRLRQSLKAEYIYPFQIEGHDVDTESLRDLLGDDFAEAYRKRGEEFSIPPRQRIHCTQKILESTAPMPGMAHKQTQDQPSLALSRAGIREAEEMRWPLTICGAVVGRKDESDRLPPHCWRCQGAISYDGSNGSNGSNAFRGLTLGIDYQRCPNPSCRTRYELKDGCNHMKCAMCKEEFCFICGKAGTDNASGHWNLGNPCPRYGQPGADHVIYDPPPGEEINDENEEENEEEQNRIHYGMETARFQNLFQQRFRIQEIPGHDTRPRRDVYADAVYRSTMTFVYVEGRAVFERVFPGELYKGSHLESQLLYISRLLVNAIRIFGRGPSRGGHLLMWRENTLCLRHALWQLTGKNSGGCFPDSDDVLAQLPTLERICINWYLSDARDFFVRTLHIMPAWAQPLNAQESATVNGWVYNPRRIEVFRARLGRSFNTFFARYLEERGLPQAHPNHAIVDRMFQAFCIRAHTAGKRFQRRFSESDRNYAKTRMSRLLERGISIIFHFLDVAMNDDGRDWNQRVRDFRCEQRRLEYELIEQLGSHVDEMQDLQDLLGFFRRSIAGFYESVRSVGPPLVRIYPRDVMDNPAGNLGLECFRVYDEVEVDPDDEELEVLAQATADLRTLPVPVEDGPPAIDMAPASEEELEDAWAVTVDENLLWGTRRGGIAGR